MHPIVLSILFAAVIFGGILACMRIGWKVGRKRFLALGEDGQSGLGAIDGAVFGLMGLLIAFTFTGAASRFDARRELVTQHVNAIGTAWLRLDLLAEPGCGKAREGFRQYVDTLLQIVRQGGDPAALRKSFARLNSLQDEIWQVLVHETKTDKSLPLAQAILPPANEMWFIREVSS